MFFKKRIRFLRRGQAQIEFALGLPLILALFSIPFGVCAIIENRTSVAIQARNKAFAFRNDYHQEEANPKNLSLSQAAFFGQLRTSNLQIAPEGGMLEGDASSQTDKVWGPMKAIALRSSHRVAVFAGTWDHREIRFADESQHPPLVLDPMLKNVRPGMSTGAFLALTDLRGFNGLLKKPDFLEDLTKLQERWKEDVKQVKDDRKTLGRELKDLNERKQNALTDAEKERIEGEIKEKRKEFDRLVLSEEKLNKSIETLALQRYPNLGAQEESEE